MNSLLIKLAVPLSGNVVVQSVVEKIVFSQFLHYITGIGSSVIASSETILVKMLKQHLNSAQPLCIFDVSANRGVFVEMS